MSRTIRRVGFAGMGLMGARMARTLRRRGFEVVVWNRSEAKVAPLRGEGFEVADSPAALAAAVEVFCTCVADPHALEGVALGPSGLLAGARKGQIFIDFSTVSPETTKGLEAAFTERGVQFVEAPVTGSKTGAENGTLLLMVGGDAEAVKAAEPVLLGVGEKVVHCGPVGAGSTVKLAGNLMIAAMLEALSEGMLATSAAGVDPRKLLEVVQASGFRSPYFDFKGKALLERNFETHFAIDLMFKDLSLFADQATKLRLPTPIASATKDAYQWARAAGKGEADIAAVVTVLEEVSGKRIA